MKPKNQFEMILRAALLAVFVCFTAAAVHAQKPKGKPWSAPEAAAKMKSPIKADADNIAAGKALFAKHCKSCHGSSGKGDGPKAANLDISCGDFTSESFKQETEGTVYYKTTEGRDPMPTFKKKISDEERWQIVAYIETLGKK